ncbi:hypothetical protein FPV67DRAFT_1407681 [Lyophyllum atratum]|nr:hypothetical protein FPV67DRAFT_1407681 [Lyophyllum atratum]
MNSRRLLGATLANSSLPISADSPRKFAIGGFLPLPSISASPVCTPTTSVSQQEPLSEEAVLRSLEDYTTAPSSPSSLSCRVSSPPTWISTPPTPPPKMVRRSVTSSTRLTSPLLPSASFPASTFPHETGYIMKRSHSVSSMPQRPPTSTSSRSQRFHGRDSFADLTSCRGNLVATSSDATESSATPKGPLLSRSKPLFHIPNDACTDPEDSIPCMTDSPERMNEDASVEGSWSDNDSDESRNFEKAKDDIRKYHALKELLDTEVGYLLDLRALVTVYLRILPTLVCRPPPSTTFSRASSSFTSSPWVNSYTHIHAVALSASSVTISDSSASQSPSSSQTKESHKSIQRYLFTSQEVELLTRNAEEILQLHEQFVRELRADMNPLGFDMAACQRSEDLEKTHSQALQNTDAAIRVVSTKFATEASRFASYQSFCAGHPEALDLIRKVTSQHPLEWDAFEQRCSSLVSELELCTTTAPDPSETVIPEEHDTPINVVLTKNRSRAASMSSIEGAVRTLHSRASNIPPKEALAFPTEVARREKSGRLAFIDYMIKPVQRICKYPLILDQLKLGKSIRSLFPALPRLDVDVVVESATQAMKHVAGAVDEARHRQDVAMQSALIASRISLASPAMSQMSSLYSSFQILTQPFLSSLGTCLLAGSLDVVHNHTSKPSGSNITAKYLGAFLYLGGYLILVKVSKGKTYEPKYWFSLADFDILDVDEVDAMLPCSIHLSSKEHRFELAAACQREKDAWLSSIRESRNHNPNWISEPTSSLRFDGKGELIPSTLDDGLFELVNTLPAVQSIPERVPNTEPPGLTESSVAFGTDTKQRKSPRQDFAWRQDRDPLSRRSSTASVKGIFSPMSSDSETIVIRRYSASARSRVDQGLQDVISQLCLTARSYASINDVELFQAPKAMRAGFVRSQSGLSMAGMAKSRLTRHESVRVLRRKSLIDNDLLSKKSSSPGQSLISRRQSRPLTIAAMPESDHGTPLSAPSYSLPSPFSTSSSMSTPAPVGSSPKSPVRPYIFSTHTAQGSSNQTTRMTPDTKSPMKTSRSLVNGVKGLFQSRSSSAVSLGHTQISDTESHGFKKRIPGSIRCWAKDTLHRRTRSAPDVPEEPFTLPDIQKLPALNFGAPMTLTRTPNPCEDPGRSDADKARRQQSLLSSTGRCHSPTEMDTSHRPTRHLSILHRLKV